MDIVDVPSYHLAYALLPYKRNQDVVSVLPVREKNYQYVACVTDGWNELSLNDDSPGRAVAQIVPQIYLDFFFGSTATSISHRANDAAVKTETVILEKFPQCATSVAVFLFHSKDCDVVISVGDEEVYLWDGKKWYKPREIDNHPSVPDNPKGSFRFFGCPSRKKDPRYSPLPDVLIFPSGAPCMLASDGIKDVLSVIEINSFFATVPNPTPNAIIGAFMDEIRRRGTQKDDISIIVRW